MELTETDSESFQEGRTRAGIRGGDLREEGKETSGVRRYMLNHLPDAIDELARTFLFVLRASLRVHVSSNSSKQ